MTDATLTAGETKTTLQLPTWSGRRTLTMTEETHQATGRTWYTIDRFGVITVDPADETHAHPTTVSLHFGRLTSTVDFGYDALPEAPAPHGVKATGGWVIDPIASADQTLDTLYHHAYITRRISHGETAPAPTGTRRTVADTGLAIARHHIARPDWHLLKDGRNRALAPSRASEALRMIHNLETTIADLTTKLDTYRTDYVTAIDLISEDPDHPLTSDPDPHD